MKTNPNQNELREHKNQVPEIIPGQDISEKFNSIVNRNEMAEVLKELFDEKKIWMISDLSSDEIKLCTRIYMVSEIKNIPKWREGLVVFLKLMLSKDRNSRKELLKAIQGLTQQRSLLQRMNPFDRGGNFG